MRGNTMLAIVLLAGNAAAQVPVIEPIPPGDDKIVPMRTGDTAPFTGQLFDTSTALRWANWLEQYRQRLKLDVARERQLCVVELKHASDLLVIEKNRAATVERDLNERLKRSESARIRAEYEATNPPWYRTVWFGVGAGFVGTATVVGLTAWAFTASQ